MLTALSDTQAYNLAISSGKAVAFEFWGTTGIYIPQNSEADELCDGQIDGPDENGIRFCQSKTAFAVFTANLIIPTV